MRGWAGPMGVFAACGITFMLSAIALGQWLSQQRRSLGLRAGGGLVHGKRSGR